MLKNSFILCLLCSIFTLMPAVTNNADIEILQDNGSSVTMEFRLNDYTVETVDIDGEGYSRIMLAGQPTFLEKGMPELPTTTRNIIIPDQGQMAYRIIEVEYDTRAIDPVVPSKGNLYR
ncbi:MAG: C25 family peptidase propeptide domain-containing protein, partial [candidate division WOR-3 bacterium]